MTRATFASMVRLTLRDPAAAAGPLRALALPMSARWSALVAAISLSVLVAWLTAQVFPPAEDTPFASLLAAPLLLAGLQIAGTIAAATAMTAIGRIFGGEGAFPDALLFLTWIEVILLLAQVLQLVLLLVMPPLAALTGLIAAALSLWLLVGLTRALHGFRNGLLVLLGIIGTGFLAVVALSFLAAALGLMPPGGAA